MTDDLVHLENWKLLSAIVGQKDEIDLNSSLRREVVAPSPGVAIPRRIGLAYLLHVFNNGAEVAVVGEKSETSADFVSCESRGVLFVRIIEIIEAGIVEETRTYIQPYPDPYVRDFMYQLRRPPGMGWYLHSVDGRASAIYRRLRTWEVYQ